MKKHLFFILIALSLSLVSCSQNKTESNPTSFSEEAPSYTDTEEQPSETESPTQSNKDHQGEHEGESILESEEKTTENEDGEKLFDIKIESSYEVLTYGIAIGESADSSTPQYDGDFDEIDVFEKENIPSRQETLFDRNVTLHYLSTTRYSNRSSGYDNYTFRANGYLGIAYYEESTNVLLKYLLDKNACTNRSYESPVNPDSTEAEYIAYARQILFDWANVSTDGWQVKISTYRGNYGTVNYFMNYSHDIPAYNAQYTFTFYKTIGGIERSDRMTVKMTNVGEIIEYNAINDNDEFFPFEDITFDCAKLEETVNRAFEASLSSSHEYEAIRLDKKELIVEDNELWAIFDFAFQEKDLTNPEAMFLAGGRFYAIKIAHWSEIDPSHS